MKTYTLEEMKDKYLGKLGTTERDEYEYELQKVFKALNANIYFNVQIENQHLCLP